MEGQIKRERNKSSQFPHMLHVRVSDRQFKDLEQIKPVMNMSDSQIIREALQMWLNQTMYKVMHKEGN